MKPAPFDWYRAQHITEVCEILRADSSAMILAGGQTLVPLLAMRRVRPGLLVDINDIPTLHGIFRHAGSVRINAGVRQAEALASPVVRRHVPMLARALPFAGSSQIRARGTVGGSMAAAGPAAEVPLVAVALDARVHLMGSERGRVLPAAEFLRGTGRTARAHDECIVALEFGFEDRPGMGSGAGFEELTPRRTGAALLAAAAQVTVDADGWCRRVTLAVAGAEWMPRRQVSAENVLLGQNLDGDITIGVRAAAQACDTHDMPPHQRTALRALVERALRRAVADALDDRTVI